MKYYVTAAVGVIALAALAGLGSGERTQAAVTALRSGWVRIHDTNTNNSAVGKV